MSDPWLETAEVFGRMATISDMESKLSAGKSDAATLWETEEQALRFLLEDGKLNLCLRSLVEFKKAQIAARKIGKGPMVSFMLHYFHQLFYSALQFCVSFFLCLCVCYFYLP